MYWKTGSSIRQLILDHLVGSCGFENDCNTLEARENFYLLLIGRNFMFYLQHYGRNDVICNYLSMKEEKRLNLSSLITWLSGEGKSTLINNSFKSPLSVVKHLQGTKTEL